MLLCGREATSRLEVSLLCSQEGLSRGPLGGKRPARGRPRLGEECGRALGDLPRLPATPPLLPHHSPPGAGHPWEDWPCPLAGRAPEGPEGAPPKAQGSLGWEVDQALPCLGRREGRAGSPTQPGAQLLGKGQAGPSSLKPIPPAGVSADQGTPRTSPQWPRSPAACSHPPSTGLCEDGYLVLLASTRQFITGH